MSGLAVSAGPAGMDFGGALIMLRAGYKMARRGWNGKAMFVYLVAGGVFAVNRAPLDVIYEPGTLVEYRPHIDMRYADGTHGVWVASQSDILSDDWMIVP